MKKTNNKTKKLFVKISVIVFFIFIFSCEKSEKNKNNIEKNSTYNLKIDNVEIIVGNTTLKTLTDNNFQIAYYTGIHKNIFEETKNDEYKIYDLNRFDIKAKTAIYDIILIKENKVVALITLLNSGKKTIKSEEATVSSIFIKPDSLQNNFSVLLNGNNIEKLKVTDIPEILSDYQKDIQTDKNLIVYTNIFSYGKGKITVTLKGNIKNNTVDILTISYKID